MDLREARQVPPRPVTLFAPEAAIGLVTRRADVATLRAAGADLVLGADGMNLISESLMHR
ncbi:hypothetical protein [Dactylosporangium sp. NPDC048998]|uniref:hypothetical protein n=1 Tax=Dactylosporangium sp. NPDC048998 TaxID=3363976 RepID=UPI003710C9C4